nr:MAG TPA: hypothetical protein [Caudoviricetes sp.]
MSRHQGAGSRFTSTATGRRNVLISGKPSGFLLNPGR